MHLNQAKFLMSCSLLNQMPADQGQEIAFVGRSNAGKSSTLNLLTQKNKLAFTSKTPGRTQEINVFKIDDTCRLIDLPGYGFAKVPIPVKKDWQILLNSYLQERLSLKGLVLITDCRHGLKPTDQQVLVWAVSCQLPVLLLLNKADKLSRQQQTTAFKAVRVKTSVLPPELLQLELFSTKSKQGFDIAYEWIMTKLQPKTEDASV
jgi:GTP-binding protein